MKLWEHLVELTTTELGEEEQVVGLKRCLCVEDSVVLGFEGRLSDLFLGEAAQHAQQKHGELAPRISKDLL